MEVDPSMNLAKWSPHILVWKRNCTEMHYYEDDYIKYFCPKTSQLPIESIGMYLRVTGIRKVLDKFFSQFPNQKVQFVNLGAGLDTVSFWVMNKFPNSVCYDSDLEYQVKLKVDILLNTKELLQMFPSHQATESTFSSPRYKLFPCDLTKVDELNKLKDFGFSDQLPTVYLNEFVFTYVPNYYTNKVINYLSTLSKAPSLFVYHELGKPSSMFAKWYYPVIEQQKAYMYSPYLYPTKESQVMRYKSLGWEHVFVHDLTFVYNQMLDKSERLRLRSIENFNDLRNLGLICSHGFLGVASKNCNDFNPFGSFLKNSGSKTSDADDELLPTFTEEELEMETDFDTIKESRKFMFNVTFSMKSEECRSYYKDKPKKVYSLTLNRNYSEEGHTGKLQKFDLYSYFKGLATN